MIASAAVGNVADQVRGVTYKKAEASKSPAPGLVGVVRAGNIVEGELTLDDLVFVPQERVSRKQMLRDGDVLIAASSGSIDVVGKAARVRGDQDVAFGAFCKVLRPRGRVDVGYFSHFFQTPAYRRYVSQVAAGASINNLKNSHLDEIEIPLPPIEEQRRIAAILDAADTLRAKRRQALDMLGSLTQAIFIAMFGDPSSNPLGLPSAPLRDLVKVKSGEGLAAKQMRPGPYFVYGGNGVNGSHDEFLFEDSKVVIGRVGVYCGCVHVSQPRSWITDNALFVRDMSEDLTLRYLAAALQMANLNQYASQAAQPLISGSRIYPVEILIPSIEEQRRFELALVQHVALASAAQSHSDRLNDLFASLQQRAFRGEL